MKVLQTSGLRDVKDYEQTSSILINERQSLNLPFECEKPLDLAIVAEAWNRLPETIKAAIVTLVRVALK